jgi:GNAT superfamily N-acetyltransferase
MILQVGPREPLLQKRWFFRGQLTYNRSVNAIQIADAKEFLSITEAFRSQDPIGTGLVTSIVDSVASGHRVYESHSFWVAKDSENVVGIAIRTAPYGYVVVPMSTKACQVLAHAICEADPDFPDVAGNRQAVEDFSASSGKVRVETEGELIYRLRQLRAPEPFGSMRQATMEDFGFLKGWMEEFMAETGLLAFDTENVVRLVIERGGYFILNVTGEDVSFGGHSKILGFTSGNIGRIGPIYTPKHFRKRGYASLITAYISQLLLDQGALPTLYTQATNPTSNKIYQDLGFELVDENLRIKCRANR